MSENVESLKEISECVTDKNEISKSMGKFREDIGGIGEGLELREGCLTLERKDADVLNERICREEVEKCVAAAGQFLTRDQNLLRHRSISYKGSKLLRSRGL